MVFFPQHIGLSAAIEKGAAGVSAVQFYQNNGTGSFTRLSNSGTFGVGAIVGFSSGWGDFDRDGYVDLIVTHPSGFFSHAPNLLFHNRGDGRFASLTEGPVVTGFAP